MKQTVKEILVDPSKQDEYQFFDEKTKTAKADFFRHIISIIRPNKTWEDVSLVDVTKIEIAKNIQDQWIKDAKDYGIEDETVISTLMVYGPKVNLDFKDNQVLIEQDAIKWED